MVGKYSFTSFFIIFSAVSLKSDPLISPLLLEPGAFLFKTWLGFMGDKFDSPLMMGLA